MKTEMCTSAVVLGCRVTAREAVTGVSDEGREFAERDAAEARKEDKREEAESEDQLEEGVHRVHDEDVHRGLWRRS